MKFVIALNIDVKKLLRLVVFHENIVKNFFQRF